MNPLRAVLRRNGCPVAVYSIVALPWLRMHTLPETEMRYYTADDLLRKLRNQVDLHGSQRAVAELHGVSDAYLSDVLNGRRDIGGKLATALGYERVTLFVPLGGGA